MSHCEPSQGPSLPAAVAGAEALQQGVLVTLLGRPNCGKSSLFNQVTGGHAHVGNFPGVQAEEPGWHMRPHKLTINLPPLGVVVFKPE